MKRFLVFLFALLYCNGYCQSFLNYNYWSLTKEYHLHYNEQCHDEASFELVTGREAINESDTIVNYLVDSIYHSGFWWKSKLDYDLGSLSNQIAAVLRSRSVINSDFILHTNNAYSNFLLNTYEAEISDSLSTEDYSKLNQFLSAIPDNSYLKEIAKIQAAYFIVRFPGRDYTNATSIQEVTSSLKTGPL